MNFRDTEASSSAAPEKPGSRKLQTELEQQVIRLQKTRNDYVTRLKTLEGKIVELSPNRNTSIISPHGVTVEERYNVDSLMFRGTIQHDVLEKLQVTLKIFEMQREREAKKCFMLPSHQNVIRHVTIGTFKFNSEPHIYIAMEQCYISTLGELVRSWVRPSQRRGHYPSHASDYLSYSIQLAHGVKFLHGCGATLRNFKPDNILLSTDKGNVKIHDFRFDLKISTQSHEVSSDWWSFEKSSTALDVLCLGLVLHFLWSDGDYALQYHVSELHQFSVTKGGNLKISPTLDQWYPELATSFLKRILAWNPSDRPSVEEILRHSFSNGAQSKDKLTDTKDLVSKTDVATEPVETDVYARSGVITKYGCLDGMAISKSITRVVGLQGGQISVGGCSVVFPKDSFVESSTVTLTSEIDTSKWPKKFIGFTPTLYVDAPNLRGKLHVKLPSWCVNNQPDKIEARVLHLPHGSTEWEDIGATLPFTNAPYFEFEWKDFSPILVGIWPFSSKEEVIEYRVTGSVYASDFNEVSIAYYVNNDMALEKVSKVMASGKHSKDFLISLNPFTTKPNEEIGTNVTCVVPDNVRVIPKGPFSFSVDDNFSKELSFLHHTTVFGDLGEDQLAHFECRVSRAGSQINGPYGFTYSRAPKTKIATKQRKAKQSEEPKQVKVEVNIAGDKTDNSQHRGKSITAQNYADNHGQVANAQADTKVQLKKRFMSAGEARDSDASDLSDVDDERELKRAKI